MFYDRGNLNSITEHTNYMHASHGRIDFDRTVDHTTSTFGNRQNSKKRRMPQSTADLSAMQDFHNIDRSNMSITLGNERELRKTRTKNLGTSPSNFNRH